jgi:hypothetical protein
MACATGSEASAGSAIGRAGSWPLPVKAIVGTIGPVAVAICRHSMRDEDSLGSAPDSAMTTADGLTDTKAVGASVQLASMMGKAPAAASAATRSAAGCSATTIIGPWSDMGTHAGYKIQPQP